MDHQVRLSRADQRGRQHGGMASPFLVGLMICTWLAVDAVIARETLLLDPAWPDFQIGLLLGTIFGQAALLAHWLVHRAHRPALPVLVITGALGSFAYAAAWATDGAASAGRWCTVLALYTLLAGLADSSTLWMPFSLKKIGRRPWQTSLAKLFCLMTLTAAGTAFQRWAELPRKPFLVILAFCCLLALLAKVAFDASRPQHSWISRFIVCSALVGVVAGCLSVTHLGPANTFMLAVMATTQVFWIVTSLAIIRTARDRSLQTVETLRGCSDH